MPNNFDKWANQALGNNGSGTANRAPASGVQTRNPTPTVVTSDNTSTSASTNASSTEPMNVTLPPLVDSANEGTNCADRCYQAKMAKEVECTMKRKRVERWLNDQGCKSVVLPADSCGNIIFDDKMYPSHQQRLMGNSHYYRQPNTGGCCGGCGNP